MSKIALTDVGLRSLCRPERGQRVYWDAGFKAGLFGCRVSQGGAKSFVLKSKNRYYTIGKYPAISLQDARSEAKRLLAEITLGRVHPEAISYAKAVELFLAEKEKARRARTVADYKRLLNRFNFQGQLVELTHAELQRRIKRFNAPGEYNHLLVALKVFCNWAIKRHYVEHNPTQGLSTHAQAARTRVLTDAEILLIWRACELNTQKHLPSSDERRQQLHGLPAHFATIVRLLILTGQRRGEIAALKTEYILWPTIPTDTKATLTERNAKLTSNVAPDPIIQGAATTKSQGDSTQEKSGTNFQCTITLPPTLTKNGREHTFPIGSLAAKILSELPCTSLLFPARGSDPKNPTPFNGWSKAKAQLDQLSGVSDWTIHDIRRTVATRMAEMGVAPHVIERLLNHISGQISGVAAVYNRARYLEEMREAMSKWEAHITQIIASKAVEERAA